MASRRARACRWAERSAGGQGVPSSTKSGCMNRVWLVLFLAAGQTAQRVVACDISLCSFRHTRQEKPPGNSFLGVNAVRFFAAPGGIGTLYAFVRSRRAMR